MHGYTVFSSSDVYSLNYQDRKPVLNVYIYNCTFIPMNNRQLSCDYLVGIKPESAQLCNITIKSSTFMNFYNLTDTVHQDQPHSEYSLILDKLL